MPNIALPFQRKANSECYNVVTYGQLLQQVKVSLLGKQWWRSSESTHFPPMWPWFDSLTRRHMKVEFVGSLLCSERFFPLLQNLHLIKFNLYTTPPALSFKTYRIIIIIIIIIISQSVYELSLFQWDSGLRSIFLWRSCLGVLSCLWERLVLTSCVYYLSNCAQFAQLAQLSATFYL